MNDGQKIYPNDAYLQTRTPSSFYDRFFFSLKKYRTGRTPLSIKNARIGDDDDNDDE